IFPLFLFLVGAVLPFSLAKYGTGAAAHWRIARRTLLLVLLGLVCNGLFQLRFVATDGGLHLDWSQIRLAGVLQRIGICYGLAALATTLLGALAGHWLRTPHTARRKTVGLAAAGLVCLLLGELWSLWLPVIKNIWTDSFVLVAGGWSLLLLALFYGVIDGLKWRRWAF